MARHGIGLEAKHRARIGIGAVNRIHRDDNVVLAHALDHVEREATQIEQLHVVGNIVSRQQLLVHGRAYAVVEHKLVANAEHRDAPGGTHLTPPPSGG